MLYKHMKSGDNYRRIFDAFDNDTQEHCVIYMSVDTGMIFTTRRHRWNEAFKYISNPQAMIEPRDDKQTELDV